ncbi:MAG TPA: DedA family protein/thiosulfate sulfurtransferase GlpE [Pararobbsia sp.]|nr:DedA family protein/thiosulfate sulfurtransferase GlpE [Pararobbsia sp.]
MLHDLLAQYGPLIVFASVFASAIGLPVPALPTLVLFGAMAAMHPGSVWQQLLPTLAMSVCASVLGDTVWFLAGRVYGGKTLQTICRVSLSRDTCVKKTERFFGRWGVRILAVSKFIPGLSLVSIPLAGAMGVPLSMFLRYDAIGGALWAGVGLLVGVAFAPQIDMIFVGMSRLGKDAALVIGVLVVAYVAYRWWRRRSLMHTLSDARMSVDELYKLMKVETQAQAQADAQAAMPPVIFDIRSNEKRQLDPFQIPGSVFADERDLENIAATYERGQKLVIYCSCPNEVSAAWMAKKLNDMGFSDVIPLRGGLDAWREAGWQVAPIVEEAANDAEIGVAIKAV